MNDLEKAHELQNSIVTAINESALPLSTVHFLLLDIQRQIQDALTKPAAAGDQTDTEG